MPSYMDQKTVSFIQRAREVHGNYYEYPDKYHAMKHPIKIICPKHGPFETTPSIHIYYKSICPKCNTERRSDYRSNFIEKATASHGIRYDYSNVVYTNNTTKVEIICPEHGPFWQTPKDHKRGRGCQKCNGGGHTKKTTKEFIEGAQRIHERKYDYSKTKYGGSRQKVTIICKEHGEFNQIAGDHLRGSGCPTCWYNSISSRLRSRTISTEEWIVLAKSVHNDAYNYSKINYTGVDNKVTIICKKHGEFEQVAYSHIKGHGCRTCMRGRTSKPEKELLDFIQSFGFDAYKTSNIIHPKELDVYIPKAKIAIEFCGLFWHSEYINNDHHYHLKKLEACQKKGIRLITIFEDEWNFKRDIVKSTIRHLLGKSKKGVYARKTEIREIPWEDTKEFLDSHHLLGSGTPGSKSLGAFYEGFLIGVMTFGRPVNEQGKSKIVEMKRFVTDGRNHPGLGSKMFKWAIREYDFSSVFAFVDRRWFVGNFKFASGFKEISTTPPSLFWTDFKERFHRRFQTKKRLIAEHGFDNDVSKKEMMKSLGYYRIWDCGKIKLKWTQPRP